MINRKLGVTLSTKVVDRNEMCRIIVAITLLGIFCILSYYSNQENGANVAYPFSLFMVSFWWKKKTWLAPVLLIGILVFIQVISIIMGSVFTENYYKLSMIMLTVITVAFLFERIERVRILNEINEKLKKRTKDLEDSNYDLKMEILRREQLEEELQDSEKKLKDIIHFSPVPQFVINTEHEVVYWNKALEAQSNINTGEIVGTNNHWKAFYSKERPCMADLLVDGNLEDIPKYFGNKYKRSNILDDACESIDFFPSLGENGSWLHLTATSIRNSKGKIIGALETLQDISEQKDAESKIMKSLKEKEVLLREIHHRVKNNLQIISSLINLQSNYLEDEKTSETFKEIQNRVKSIALLHEKLYQSNDLSKINLADYIPQIALDLYKSYGVGPDIKLDIDIEDVLLDINKALPCGLIINELLTNSIKHAFSKERTLSDKNDKIRINLQQKENIYQLIVSDNGMGYPDDLDINKTKTLGLSLVNGLKDQLNGQIELKNKNGAFFKLTFQE